MELLKKLRSDRMAARKAKDTFRTKVLTTLVGEAETLIKAGRPYDTESLLIKFRKGLEETLKVKQVQEAVDELAIINSYLPKELTTEELTDLINEFPTGTNRGVIMSHLSKNYKGRFNGKLANEIISKGAL